MSTNRWRSGSPLRVKLLALLGSALLLTPLQARAQDAGTLPMDGPQAAPRPVPSPEDRAAIQAQIDLLKRDFDARIQALEQRLGDAPSNAAVPGAEGAAA